MVRHSKYQTTLQVLKRTQGGEEISMEIVIRGLATAVHGAVTQGLNLSMPVTAFEFHDNTSGFRFFVTWHRDPEPMPVELTGVDPAPDGALVENAATKLSDTTWQVLHFIDTPAGRCAIKIPVELTRQGLDVGTAHGTIWHDDMETFRCVQCLHRVPVQYRSDLRPYGIDGPVCDMCVSYHEYLNGLPAGEFEEEDL